MGWAVDWGALLAASATAEYTASETVLAALGIARTHQVGLAEGAGGAVGAVELGKDHAQAAQKAQAMHGSVQMNMRPGVTPPACCP